MKNIILIIFFLTAMTTYSQDKDKYERIKALKVSFITEELELTPAEAEKFWPIYNSYDSKMHDLRKRERRLFHEKYNSDGVKNKLSEDDSKELIEEYNTVLNERHSLEKRLMDDLVKKLPASKIVFLPEVERQFGQKLFEEYKKRKNKNGTEED
ncbi:sensor of ECF-type sigma factor [Leeuwenhoekiella sp. A16]|uniref:sensor of ECF-type sigma factor n=1 Tax=unclassified Leeuwenhoekiella TaxID=2615029 RepID=UPI003A80EAE8|tara:strand:+ start:156 stop:617 length:462 start_codon:yes stop_codon:yes gene_type:complete